MNLRLQPHFPRGEKKNERAILAPNLLPFLRTFQLDLKIHFRGGSGSSPPSSGAPGLDTVLHDTGSPQPRLISLAPVCCCSQSTPRQAVLVRGPLIYFA